MSPVHTAPGSHEFVKRLDCPASEVLLAYAGEAVHGLRREGIKLHLAHCDFCDAELRLLKQHPPAAEAACVPAQLPLSLLLFAGQSLPRKQVVKKPLRKRAA
jgi:hypothetical protein